MDSDRTLAQKIILWALLAMAVVFTVVVIILKFLPGVEFEDTLLKVTQNGEETVYTGEKYKYDITITVTPEENGHTVALTIGNAIDHLYRVEYPGDTIVGKYGSIYQRITVSRVREGDVVKILFDGGYNPDGYPFSYCDLQGTSELLPLSGRVDVYDTSWQNYELTYKEVVSFADGPEITTRGSWAHYAMALFCSAICAVAAAFPYTLFELRYHWSVRDPEPTDFYLNMNTLSCGVVAFVILIVYLIGVTKIV